MTRRIVVAVSVSVGVVAVAGGAWLARGGGTAGTGAPGVIEARDAALASTGYPREALVLRARGVDAPFSFVSTASDRPEGREVLVADDRSAPAAVRALSFLADYGGLVGLSGEERAALGTDDATLEVTRVETDAIGMTHVRMAQVHRGLPVHGAELVVHLDDRGVTGVNGDYVPGVAVPVDPEISRDEAATAAVSAASAPASPIAAALVVFREGLLEGASGPSLLAWAVDIAGETVHERVFVDAISGVIEARHPLSHTGLYRIIYSPEYVPAFPDLFVQRREGEAPSLVPAVNNLYDFAGQTYDLYASGFGHDSFDGQGAIMRSVYLVNQNCPNAYWNGTTTNYCPGFDLDDVVSHEWTHAYTQFTHGLIYSWQSGALNESYSDIFGEQVDLLNAADGLGGANNAQPFPDGQRWLVGEDLGQVVHELLLRDMWDPERLFYPSKVTSGNYYCGTSDGGGVHTNSGVPNHAFAMLVDGKSFNGRNVGGIGLTKAANVYFRAMRYYQTPATDFADHADALEASCADLAGVPLTALSTTSAARVPSGEAITAADCAQVAEAMLAVEMRTPPTQCGFQPQLAKNPPARCEGRVTTFFEDFETGDDGWTSLSAGLFPEWPGYTWTVRGSLPEARSGSAAFAFDDRAGTCAPGGDHSGTFSTTSPDLAVTASAQLRFTHYVETELNYDGGNVLYSVNGGAFRLVPQSAYLYNAPSRTLATVQNTNPKFGERAWHGADGGSVTGSWGETVIALSALASPGDVVKVRFEFGVDGCNGVTGWFVDDVVVDDCSANAGIAPIAAFTHSPEPATADSEVAFDGSASSDPDGGSIVSWTWSFGDGSEDVTTSTPSATHVYGEAGTFTVTLTVLDEEGTVGSATGTVTVQAPAVSKADLRVTSVSLSPIKHGARIFANVANEGSAGAPPSHTEFLLDGRIVLGVVDTPAIAAGGNAVVSVDFDARGRGGAHDLDVTADRLLAVDEADETDNTTTRTLQVQGTRVK